MEAVRDAVVGDRHQKISDAPAYAVEPGALRTRGFTRDPDALFDLALDIASHRVRERAVVDSQHHLEVEEEASHVEIRRSDVDAVVEDEQLGVQLGRLVFVAFDAALAKQTVTVAAGNERTPIVSVGCGTQQYEAAPS